MQFHLLQYLTLLPNHTFIHTSGPALHAIPQLSVHCFVPIAYSLEVQLPHHILLVNCSMHVPLHHHRPFEHWRSPIATWDDLLIELATHLDLPSFSISLTRTFLRVILDGAVFCSDFLLRRCHASAQSPGFLVPFDPLTMANVTHPGSELPSIDKTRSIYPCYSPACVLQIWPSLLCCIAGKLISFIRWLRCPS